MQIIPAILEKDWTQIEEKLEKLKGLTKTVHVDFIKDKSFLDPNPFLKYKDEFYLSAHFIGFDPTEKLDEFSKVGFKRFVAQVEDVSNQAEFIAKAQILGEAGLSIDLDTNLDKLNVDLFDLDLVVVMTVKAGASGQVFSEKATEKVKELKNRASSTGKNINIEVDGGINDQTILKAKDAGANMFITNSYIFNGDLKERLNKLSFLLSA